MTHNTERRRTRDGDTSEVARDPTETTARDLRLPGFVDLQVNGFAGVDFNNPSSSEADLTRAFEAMRATGVTRCLPTLITSSLAQFTRCARRIVELRHPTVAGLHMEGPFISPIDGPRGAHPREHVRPASVDEFERYQEATDGRIVLVTLAPETAGALPLIEHLAVRGVRVALGHTQATPEQIDAAVAAGATLSTHLGNGCAPILPRHPNLLWDQLAHDDLLASFIVDGHHLPASVVKVMMRAKTPRRSVLVTDAVSAAGASPGRYTLGEAQIELSPTGRVSLPGTSSLAGSALSMDRAIGLAVRATGLSLDEVVRMAATQPATYLGIEPAGSVLVTWQAETCELEVNRVIE